MPNSLTTLILAPALLWVVVSDLLYRRIANRLLLVLLLLWLCLVGWQWQQNGLLPWPALSTGVLTALAVLIAGYLLFTLRWMGAGDVKLMAVLCLWLDQHALTFLMVTTLAGGAMALAMPLLRRFEHALGLVLAYIQRSLPDPVLPAPLSMRGATVQGIPYGLAIAFGAAFVLWGLP
jgi:prepilin peptidase CpaA